MTSKRKAENTPRRARCPARKARLGIASFGLLFLVCGLQADLSGDEQKTAPVALVEGQNSEMSAKSIPIRDPFWPIGYAPPSMSVGQSSPSDAALPQTVSTNQAPPTLADIFKIGGVMKKDGKFYAIINGFTVQAGEVVSAVSGGEVYKFVVETIDLKKVQLKPLK